MLASSRSHWWVDMVHVEMYGSWTVILHVISFCVPSFLLPELFLMLPINAKVRLAEWNVIHAGNFIWRRIIRCIYVHARYVMLIRDSRYFSSREWRCLKYLACNLYKWVLNELNFITAWFIPTFINSWNTGRGYVSRQCNNRYILSARSNVVGVAITSSYGLVNPITTISYRSAILIKCGKLWK